MKNNNNNSAIIDMLVCSKCGNRINLSENSKSCKNCGTTIEETVSETKNITKKEFLHRYGHTKYTRVNCSDFGWYRICYICFAFMAFVRFVLIFQPNGGIGINIPAIGSFIGLLFYWLLFYLAQKRNSHILPIIPAIGLFLILSTDVLQFRAAILLTSIEVASFKGVFWIAIITDLLLLPVLEYKMIELCSDMKKLKDDYRQFIHNIQTI